MTISQKIAKLKQLAGSKFFSVVFRKKDNSLRTMLCQFGPKEWKGDPTTKGGTLKYDPASKGLMVVWSVNDKAWRMVNLDTLSVVKIGNKNYTAKKLFASAKKKAVKKQLV